VSAASTPETWKCSASRKEPQGGQRGQRDLDQVIAGAPGDRQQRQRDQCAGRQAAADDEQYLAADLDRRRRMP
jgi:hypothetical protein